MPFRPAVAFLYDNANRCSVNALIGTLEVHSIDISIVLRPHLEALREYVHRHIKTHEPLLLALSFTSARRPEILQWIQTIRSECTWPRLAIITGGADPTAFPLPSLEAGVDAVAIGEAENSFPILVEDWLNQRTWREQHGIATLDSDGTLHKSAHPPSVSLDEYPPFPIKQDICGAVELTRGCPHLCSFCQVPAMHGTLARHRGIEMVLESARSMLRTNRQDYRFITPDAFAYGSPDTREARLDAAEELLARLRETVGHDRRIYLGSFPSEVRPEHVTSKGVALITRYCDNDNLVLGAQTGSNRLLAACHRGHTIEDVFRAAEIIARAGLLPNVDFIFGLPGETDHDVQLTIEAMEKLTQIGARIHTHTFMPLPQTRFAGRRGGAIHPTIRQHLLGQLLPRGQAYGNWLQQEKLARRLNREQGRQR